MLVFAFIFSIGLHIAFGNDVESYALLGDAFLSVYAAFFGDSDRGEMMTADSNTDSSVMGALFWLFMHIFGVGLLSNIFIAVVGDVYSTLIQDMEVTWDQQVTLKMRRDLWNNVVANLHDFDGFMPELLERLPKQYQEGKQRPLRSRWMAWFRLHRRPLRDLLSSILAPIMFGLGLGSEQLDLLNPHYQDKHCQDKRDGSDASARPRLAAAENEVGSDVTLFRAHTGKEALKMLKVEEAHTDLAKPYGWYAQQWPEHGGGGTELPRRHDSSWYDDEAALRFRFSWSIVPRFNDEEVRLELESAEDYLQRLRSVQQHELLAFARSFQPRK